MIFLYGQLVGLKELGFLDCVFYIIGVLGFIWVLVNFYEDLEWFQKDLVGFIELLKIQVIKSKFGVLVFSQLQWYWQELVECVCLGYLSCFISLWVFINEVLLYDEFYDYKFLDQWEVLSYGQNFLFIYCVFNIKGQSLFIFEFGEWCEFFFYEVGFFKYGVFIFFEFFGFEFFMGQLMKRFFEFCICFLEGIWSNLYVVNFQDSLYWVLEFSQFWDYWVRNQVSLDKEQVFFLKIEELFLIVSRIVEFFIDFLIWCLLVQVIYNFLCGFYFYKDYFQYFYFFIWKVIILDGFFNQLIFLELYLCLLDVGYFINISCLFFLQFIWDVDFILLLDYNFYGVFQQLQFLGWFCQEQGILFLFILFSLEEQFQFWECYIFFDFICFGVFVVLYFFFVNDFFWEYLVFGVWWIFEVVVVGEVNLFLVDFFYYYMKVIYSQEDVDKLLCLIYYNVCNNWEQLLEVLCQVVQWRWQCRFQ